MVSELWIIYEGLHVAIIMQKSETEITVQVTIKLSGSMLGW